MVSLLLALLLSGPAARAASPGSAKRPDKAKIAVLDFAFSDTNTSPSRSKINTDLLTTKINTALVSSRRFDVVERSSLDAILTEGKFSRSRLTDPRVAATAGRLLGAQYLVLGEISVLEVGGIRSKVPYVETWKADWSGFMVLDFRVVDVETGKIERAGKVESQLRQTVQLGDSPRSTEPSELFYEDLEREAAERTAAKIVAALFPVKISLFDSGTAYLNIGEGTGIAVGDLFIVQETGQEIFDPDTGDSLGVVERPVAVVEVTAVEERRSKARLLGGRQGLSPGMICRTSSPSEAQRLLQTTIGAP